MLHNFYYCFVTVTCVFLVIIINKYIISAVIRIKSEFIYIIILYNACNQKRVVVCKNNKSYIKN